MKKFITFLVLLLMVNAATAQTAQQRSDSAQIRNTIIKFYKWYNTAWKKVDAFALYQSKNNNDGPPYIINWKEVEKYFAYLRKNVPYVGSAFIKNERMLFAEIDKGFRQNPTEEIAIGFDADRFTNTQEEPMFFWNELMKKTNRWRIVVTKKGQAVVKVMPEDDKDDAEDYTIFCGSMIKEKGIWKIARLHCDEDIENN